MTNEEKSRVLSVKASCEAYFNKEAQKQYLNQSTETIARINAYGACMEMAEWKDEEMKKILVDFMQYLYKRGFIQDDLCYDTEHQVETFIELRNRK